MLRLAAKRALERLLLLTGGSPSRMARQTLVLSYHNVVPDNEAGRGDQSLHLPWSSFRRQLDLLQKHCAVVTVNDALDTPATGDRPRVVITFDDAYRGAVDLAIPELQRRQLPSTLFVAPGLFGAASMWWDELAREDGLSLERRETALQQHSGSGDEIRQAFSTELTTGLPSSYGCATEAEVRARAADGHLKLGAHTWTHPNLAQVDASVLKQEVARPLAWLNSLGSNTIPVLAYPYGLSDAHVEQAAATAGYRAAFRVEGGWMPSTIDAPWRLPRLNIPAGLTEEGFLLRLAGRLVS